MESDQLAAEIAQIASVEQLTHVNEALRMLAHQNRPLEKLFLAQWIGKVVTVDRSRFQHQQNKMDHLSFQLSEPLENVKIRIVAETGETVDEQDVGHQPEGMRSFVWDGKVNAVTAARTGTYFFEVEGSNAKGVRVKPQLQWKARVVGVGLDGQDPMLLVGDARQQEKVGLKEIVQVEWDPKAGSLPGT
jgi:flagellar hook assembly protein FlgD